LNSDRHLDGILLAIAGKFAAGEILSDAGLLQTGESTPG